MVRWPEFWELADRFSVDQQEPPLKLPSQGVGVYFLKFSREYETEADILGAQMMARAGYDPRDLAAMFQTIERQGGGSSGGFLSSHPSPQNRYARINQEAQYLRVEGSVRDNGEFARIQARLRGNPRAPSMAEIARSGQRYPAEGAGNDPAGYARWPSGLSVHALSQLQRTWDF